MVVDSGPRGRVPGIGPRSVYVVAEEGHSVSTKGVKVLRGCPSFTARGRQTVHTAHMAHNSVSGTTAHSTPQWSHASYLGVDQCPFSAPTPTVLPSTPVLFLVLLPPPGSRATYNCVWLYWQRRGAQGGTRREVEDKPFHCRDLSLSFAVSGRTPGNAHSYSSISGICEGICRVGQSWFPPSWCHTRGMQWRDPTSPAILPVPHRADPNSP